MKRRRTRHVAAVAVMIGSLAAQTVLAAQEPPQQKERDLTELSLEELTKIEVTSASRKEQRLDDVPAAIFVIRGEDIRRAGIRSIPEALRMAPGVQVAKIDANKWSVSIRGFAGRFGNKLQVLVDGRSVYSPLFSGVFWDALDTDIDDIERIEVIRGPGASVWGANAVNGVINIITKKAKDAQGSRVTAGGGTEERAFVDGRYGGKTEDNLYYKAFAKYFDRDSGWHGHDDWHQARAGFRGESPVADRQTLTVMGDFYQGQSGTRVTVAQPPPLFQATSDNPYDVSGGYLMGRWENKLTDTSSLSAQLSWTSSELDTRFFAERRNTVDFDATHRFKLSEEQDVVWGVGARVSVDNTRPSFVVTFDPEDTTTEVFSVFVQDEIQFIPKTLWGTAGLRLEHNNYTGVEVQPSARLAWRPHENHLVWASWSRATRTPSRTEEDIRLNEAVLPPNPPGNPLPTYISLFGDNVKSEVLNAFELGYRVQPAERVSVDVAAFYNRYNRLSSNETGAPFLEPAGLPDHVVVPITFDDLHKGAAYGLEAVVWWQPLDKVRVQASYTFLRMNLQNGHSTDGTRYTERQNPRGRAFARISYDLSESVLLDVMGRYVSSNSSEGIHSYNELDARIAWKATQNIELALVGQNLIHAHHFESGDSGLNEEATAVQRGVFAYVTVKF